MLILRFAQQWCYTVLSPFFMAVNMRHFHIRWSDGKLDWQAFTTESEAEERAKELVLPDETYTIEKADQQCPRCEETARLLRKRAAS
jgi:hypothetical protein